MKRHRIDVARVYGKVVTWQRLPVVGPVLRIVLFVLLSIDVPRAVVIGDDLRIMHGGSGLVVHRNTVIGDSVTLFPQVTVGRSSMKPDDGTTHFVIGDRAVLSVGSKVLASKTTLVVAPDSIVGANAVLTESTGPGETWVGIPARRLDKPEG